MIEKKLTDDEMKDILFQCYVNAEKGEGTTEVQLKAMREYAAQQVAAERERIKKLVKDLVSIAEFYHDSRVRYTDMPYKNWNGVIKNAKELIDSL